MIYPKWNMTCPKCGKTVDYYPNCSPRTARDFNNYDWLIRRDGIKQFLHKKCPVEKSEVK